MGSHIPHENEDLRKRLLWLEYRVTKVEKDLDSVFFTVQHHSDMLNDDGR